MVLTGVAARKLAGPGVVLSYGIAAVAALLTSFCYAEYAADLPVAGAHSLFSVYCLTCAAQTTYGCALG